MKPIHRLHILPSLPPELSPLWDLTHNLWTWSPQTIRTLQQIDPETWIASGRDPRRFLSLLKEDQLRTLVEDRDSASASNESYSLINATAIARLGSKRTTPTVHFKSPIFPLSSA